MSKAGVMFAQSCYQLYRSNSDRETYVAVISVAVALAFVAYRYQSLDR